MWEYFDTMFPSGGIQTDKEYVTKDYAMANNITVLQLTLKKPIRSSLQEEMLFTWKEDGSFSAEYTYNVFPPNMVDNLSPLNAYGRKIYNDYMAKHYR